MYTFLLCANKYPTDMSGILDQACRITKELLPSLGVDIETRQRIIPEINGGWFYLVPRSGNKTKLISEFVNDESAILVFGGIFQAHGKSAAEIVFDAWKDRDIDSVRLLDGCFSAAIIDLKMRTIYIVSDLLGRRSLRYFYNQHSLLFSPHDIPIVATGFCSTEMNLVSASSIVVYDWSLSGQSLLKEIIVCNPHEYVTWQEGKITQIYKPLLKLEERIHARDKVSFDRQIDMMIENMRENVRVFCGDDPLVQLWLTAGVDSRSVLAILLSVIDRSRLKAFTSGETNSFEVKMAKRLAETCHVYHEAILPEPLNSDMFLEHCRLRAFMMNGDTNGKRAVHSLPNYHETPKLGGEGGAIYKGAYYPSIHGKRALIRLTIKDIIPVLEKKFYRIKHLPWLSHELPERVLSRVTNILHMYYSISPYGSDILDLLYAYERYARWGAMAAHSTWEPRRFSPFESPRLLKLGFTLPHPISNDLVLHKTIIKRYLPKAYYWPINKSTFLPLRGIGFPKAYVSRAIEIIIRRFQQFQDTLFSKKHIRTHEQKRAEILAKLLQGILGDLLLEEGSIGTRIFKKDDLETMIHDHIAGRKDHLQVIGFLAIMETYRHLIMEASTKSNRIFV